MFREFIFPGYVRMSRASKRSSRRMSERGRLIQTGTAVCFAFGIDTDLTLIYQLFALLFCLLIISRVSLSFSKPAVSIRRRLPRYATNGEPFEYYIDVSNEGERIESDLRLVDNPRTKPPTIEQFRNHREPGESTRNAYDRWIGYHRFAWLQRFNTGIVTQPKEVPDVNLRSKVSVRVEATPLRRGIVQFRSTSVLHPDPMGATWGVTNFENPEQLLILPKRYRIPERFSLPAGRHFQPGGVNSTWSVGESDEFVSLRDYRDGDSMRKIHWPSSARRNKPVVKEYQEEYLVRQAVVVDTHTNNEPMLEEAVSVAASFVLRSSNEESLVDLFYVSDKPELISSGRGQTSTNHQLESLACIGPSDQPIDHLADALALHAKRLSGCVLVLCDWDDEREALVERIQAANVPFKALVLTESPDEIEVPAYIHVLDIAHVSEGLMKL
jgi:uncharacterized protein (DUF58 family)